MWMKVGPRAMTMYSFQSFCLTNLAISGAIADVGHEPARAHAEAFDDLAAKGHDAHRVFSE